ncbi:hypothetical protein PF005_g11409 [Phytophthora fragariae]|uniref:Secreted protein n=2 Tax=Phytophthora TaxID=4783 RepID=A0A6A4DJ27_9STRA|nr:hypothetical protein PF011_g10234 [Phytophthora fragariae]KAE9025875.1 hypothetical protein PR002_g11065 [Phytophthora rubi]KAE9031612.1 hypothetical protein PR001_g10989 [Phytophthora rubi]KAE9111271.1 hypothetical protein PF010_g10870 [Phytophthora fragariae]KAE9126869.1 hypothetical protein PF007_g5815 [Phytophthora fragariae]
MHRCSPHPWLWLVQPDFVIVVFQQLDVLDGLNAVCSDQKSCAGLPSAFCSCLAPPAGRHTPPILDYRHLETAAVEVVHA